MLLNGNMLLLVTSLCGLRCAVHFMTTSVIGGIGFNGGEDEVKKNIIKLFSVLLA